MHAADHGLSHEHLTQPQQAHDTPIPFLGLGDWLIHSHAYAKSLAFSPESLSESRNTHPCVQVETGISPILGD
eukprot:15812311-Heterocapsa_arctica.AAC.1